MVPMNERLPRYVALTVFAAMIAWAGWAGAAVLSPDPDFGAQTLGSPIGSPWNPVSGSGNAASAGAQSPFTDAFPDNGIGANTPATAGNPYFVGTFSSIIPAAATGQLYFNADFRNNSADGGDYSMVITNGANGAVRTAALYVTGGALYAEGGGGTGLPILTLKPNTWYNVQLTLDLTSNTYSGKVTEHGWTTTNISSRPFLTENPINCIYSDGGTSLIGGAAPNHDIDNFALSDTPLGSPPLIATRTNIVNIDFNGVRNTPGPDVPGPTYSGSGAAGGGIVFNGIPAGRRHGPAGLRRQPNRDRLHRLARRRRRGRSPDHRSHVARSPVQRLRLRSLRGKHLGLAVYDQRSRIGHDGGPLFLSHQPRRDDYGGRCHAGSLRRLRHILQRQYPVFPQRPHRERHDQRSFRQRHDCRDRGVDHCHLQRPGSGTVNGRPPARGLGGAALAEPPTAARWQGPTCRGVTIKRPDGA
jgi:hypothetical protein